MALPPTIPTSFVPHPPGSATQRFRSGLTGAFGFFSYAILGIVFVMALGVFFYGHLLASDQSAKDAALQSATASLDPATVEGFVRLRNRLNVGGTLLTKHTAFSNFFTLLGTLLPTSVRFSSLHLALDSSGVAKVEGSGVAKSFNALAAASTAFAADGRVKDAIFSNININKDNSVSFDLSASLDPKLVTFSAEIGVPINIPSVPSTPSEPTASTTPSP